MMKRLLPLLVVFAIGFVAMFSCRKVHKPNSDQTVNYFPIKLGNTITYDVDSIVWDEASCDSYNVRSQMMYAITDTFRDSLFRLSYLMEVSMRPGYGPDNGGLWTPIREIYLTPMTESNVTNGTITTGLLYSQDGNQYMKLSFPVQSGATWQGNSLLTPDAANQWLLNWTYTYQNYQKSYNNSIVNFPNTVTVIEDDIAYNYLQVDSQVNSYRIYAEEVYAYNIGMVYKEWTHWTHDSGDNSHCKGGYQVIMQAVGYNVK